MTMQQYCLRWNNHQPNFISVFSSLLNSESLVDVTLSAEGRHLQAHKLVLSACSSYFQTLFTINPCQHPIVILKDVKFSDLKIMVDFMYYGEVNVSQEQLPHILKTAEMLKIKGLAEIPVEPSLTKSQNNVERTELLTHSDSWNTENQQQSPSSCPLSPSNRRKRLRKSSTGSGSGSTEKTSDECPPSDVTLTSPGGNITTVIKPDPGGSQTDSRCKQIHAEIEVQRGSSHESIDSDTTQQITLQIPQQQEIHIQHSIETGQPHSIEIPGPSSSVSQAVTVSERPTITTHAQLSQSQQNQELMGTKRGRFLKRQQRIKRESDSSQPCEGEVMSPQYLTVPPLRMERQCSDPLPTISPPPGTLLTIPGGILVKQHSHPLLPSQMQQHSPPVPLNIHLLPQTHSGDAERAISPVVILSDPLAQPQSENQQRTADNVATAQTATTLRVRTDELKRSSSSPQTGTRSSHCPVVRPGPALGCNYCWNTVDNHGRILRRKTKYHCPECQTNLCIVPCFQEYHERHVVQTDPIALTTSVMRVFPKTSSM